MRLAHKIPKPRILVSLAPAESRASPGAPLALGAGSAFRSFLPRCCGGTPGVKPDLEKMRGKKDLEDADQVDRVIDDGFGERGYSDLQGGHFTKTQQRMLYTFLQKN